MSSGAIKRKTPTFGLNIINYDFPRWHTFDWQNWDTLDAVLKAANLTAVKGVWQNNTSYLVGDRVVDDASSSIWICAVAHTSAVSGTFGDDRLAHPTYWRAISSVPVNRGNWVTAVVYNTWDIVKFGNAYYTATVLHTSGVFATDLADGKWALIFNYQEALDAVDTLVTEAEEAATASENSANAAATSANDAATATITNAKNGVWTQVGTSASARTIDAKLKDLSVTVDDFSSVTAALTAWSEVIVPQEKTVDLSGVAIPSNKSLVFQKGASYTGTPTVTGTLVDWISWSGTLVERSQNVYKYTMNTTASLGSVDFGPAAFRARVSGNVHAIVGETIQQNAHGDWSFPCGLTGYGKLESAGNHVFGIFGRADAHSSGVVTHEFNTFNYSSGPPGIFPPDRSFGITDTIPVCLTVAAGGDYQSLIAIQIGPEGSVPNSFVCGVYINPGSVTNYGIFVDGTATEGSAVGAFIRFTGSTSSHCGLFMQCMDSTPDASASFVDFRDSGGGRLFGIAVDGKLSVSSAPTQSTVGVAGAAEVLPSNPTGYLKLNIGGFEKAIPYYEV